jgi:hypothetical protein
MTQQAIMRSLLVLAGFWLSACGSEKNSEKRSDRQSKSSNDQIPGVKNPIVAEPSDVKACTAIAGTLRNPVTGKCKNYSNGCESGQLAEQGYTERGPEWADDVTGACGITIE